MKKSLYFAFFSIFAFFGGVNSETISMNWLNEDGTLSQTTTCEAGGDIILPTAPTKRGYTFMGWVYKHTQIEYLESTGTQYIDTGVEPNDNIGVNIGVVWLQKLDGERQISGTRYNGGAVRFYVPFAYEYRIGYGWGGWETVNLPVGQGTIYNIKFNYKNDRKVSINDNSVAVLNSHLPLNMSGETLPIFAGLYDSNRFLLIGRIYDVKITQDSRLIRDMIPVLDENNIPCMYDKVTDQYFYNAGTGQFIAGPVIGSDQ